MFRRFFPRQRVGFLHFGMLKLHFSFVLHQHEWENRKTGFQKKYKKVKSKHENKKLNIYLKRKKYASCYNVKYSLHYDA